MPLDEEAPDAAVYDTLDPTLDQPLTPQERRPSVPAEEDDTPAHFDDRHKDDLHGLLYLGALKKKFTWLGHTFVIRTIPVGDIAEIAVVASRYRDTDFAAKAYQAATVAACLITVDGRELPTIPITNNVDDTLIQAKFDYVMNRWFSPTIDRVFTEYWELEVKQKEILEAMGKASG
jgi:hypothetical protein